MSQEPLFSGTAPVKLAAKARAEAMRSWRSKNLAKHNANSAAWKKRNREAYNSRARELRRANPRRHKNYQLKHAYGITVDLYEELRRGQGGVCAICKTPPHGKPRAKREMPDTLDVDHDHETGEVRALLCRRCNLMLGKGHDDVSLLLAMARYLIAWRHRHAQKKVA